MPWVMQVRITKAGKRHGEIIEVPADELPDGVGFATRKECKDFYRRPDNAPPIWLDQPAKPKLEASGPRRKRGRKREET